MSTAAKVRLVYCPKCRQLLREFAHIPVYKCGGCGVVLRAKNHSSASINPDEAKENPESPKTNPDSPKTNPESVHNSEHNGSTSSSRCAIVCSGEAHISDLDGGSVTVECGNGDQYWSQVKEGLATVSCSDDFKCHGKDGSSETGEESDGFYAGRDSNSDSPKSSPLDFRGRNSSLEIERHIDQSLQYNKDNSSLSVDHVHTGEEREKPQELDHARSSDKTRAFKGVVNYEEGTESIASSIVSEEDMVDMKLRGDISKVPTTESYHACNGSGSSLGSDCDDITPNQQLHLAQRTLFKPQRTPSLLRNQAANVVPLSISDEGGVDLPDLQRPKQSTRENFSKHNKTNSGSELHLRARKSSSPLQLSQKHGLAIGGSNILNQGEPKSTRNGTQMQEQGNMHDREALERDETSRFPSINPRFPRYPSSVYQNGGPSNYVDRVNYGHAEPVQNLKPYAPDKLENLDQDHLELLRKVDELRDRISRRCGQTGKPNGRMPISNHGVQTSETSKESLCQDDHLYRANDTLRWASSGKQAIGTQLDKQSFSCFNHEPGLELPWCYNPNYYPNDCSALHHNPGVYVQRKIIPQAYGLSQRPFSGQYMEKDQDTVGLCAHNSHQCQYCFCFHCYPENRPIPMQFPTGICLNNGFCRTCPGHVCYHPCSTSAASPRRHIDAKFPLRYHTAHPQDQRSMDAGPENIYYKEKRHPTSTIGTKAKARHCRPIAGGAPFLTCYYCWNLLQIPADFILSGRRCHKLRCGACSKLLSFSLKNGTHIIPFSTQNEHRSGEVYDSVDTTRNKGTSLHLGTPSSKYAQHKQSESDCPQSDPISYSEDYGLSFCKSYSTESETVYPPPFPNLARKSIDEKLASSNSPGITQQYGDRGNPVTSADTLKSRSPSSDMSKTGNSSLEVKVSSRMIGSPLHKLFGYSSPSKMIRGTGVSSRRSDTGDLQIVAHNDTTSRGNTSRKEITEKSLDSPLHKDSEPGTLPDFTENSEEVDSSKNSRKIRDSSVAGFIKKGVRELGHGMKNMKIEVFINGRHLPDRLVKKAEEQAGPIQPGRYWYDYQAGFWGVMGQPCLGIIPPSIEEFNYPMPKDCAGGRTGVFVNGRELHPKDLDLLASRGLPTTKNKSYFIEISGRVVDEASGKELNSLGKLAPTVMYSGRGFGMRPQIPMALTNVD